MKNFLFKKNINNYFKKNPLIWYEYLIYILFKNYFNTHLQNYFDKVLNLIFIKFLLFKFKKIKFKMRQAILCFIMSLIITFLYLNYLPIFIKLSCIIGLTITISTGYDVLCLFLTLFRFEKNLIKRYGSNSWVVISGAA